MSEYGPENDRRDNSWHLDKKVNIGHMITTLALFGSMLISINSIQDQVVKNTEEARHQREIINRVEQTSAKRDQETRLQLDRIDSKIDRLLQRELDRTR